VGIAAAGPVGVDHSRNIQPGPSRGDCCCWPGYVHIDGKKSLVCAHRWQEKLGVCTSMARKAWCVHIAGPVGADHSIELQPGPHGIPRWPSLVEFSQGIHQVLLLTMVAVTRGRLPGDPPSAAAGYHGGRHSWNAELSWVPIRTFDRSPPMGTVLTVDRLSFGRSGFPTSTDVHPMCGDVVRRSPNVWRRGQTFTQRVETWSDVPPRWALCRRWKPGSCTLSAMEAWFLHAVGDGSLVLARCRR
jgi:hypothetical protein